MKTRARDPFTCTRPSVLPRVPFHITTSYFLFHFSSFHFCGGEQITGSRRQVKICTWVGSGAQWWKAGSELARESVGLISAQWNSGQPFPVHKPTIPQNKPAEGGFNSPRATRFGTNLICAVPMLRVYGICLGEGEIERIACWHPETSVSLVSLESGIILLCHEPVVLSLEKKYHSLGKHRERERENSSGAGRHTSIKFYLTIWQTE